MPVVDQERARHMLVRVARTMEREGVPGGDDVLAAMDVAMEPRHRLLDDDHDPRYLHPGRTVLVALSDGGVRDPEILAGAAGVETLSEELRGEGYRALGVPSPWAPDLVEELVLMDPVVQAVALSEWVDQLRHLRHWAEVPDVERAYATTESVYLPLAGRGHPDLHRRLAWWLRRVAKR